jgi:hypothetical protein
VNDEGYNILRKLIRESARRKGISPIRNKKQQWWEWEDFEHEAVAQLLEIHTTIDFDSGDPKGYRTGNNIIYYDGKGVKKREVWYEAIVNLANAILRSPKGVSSIDIEKLAVLCLSYEEGCGFYTLDVRHKLLQTEELKWAENMSGTSEEMTISSNT